MQTPFCIMLPLHQILAQSHLFQQLTPEDGPTALAVHYAQLNELLKYYRASQPIQAMPQLVSSVLDNQGRTQLTEVIDQYAKLKTVRQVRQLTEAYKEAFRQMQNHLFVAVSLLTS